MRLLHWSGHDQDLHGERRAARQSPPPARYEVSAAAVVVPGRTCSPDGLGLVSRCQHGSPTLRIGPHVVNAVMRIRAALKLSFPASTLHSFRKGPKS